MELHPKYPHPAGKTCVAYSRCGKYLFTTGSNNLIRRFLAGVNDEPDTIDFSSCPLSLATSEDHFAVAGDDGVAYLYDLQGKSPKSILARSALPIRYLEFSPSGDEIAVVGDDTVIIVNIDSSSPKRLPFQGHALTVKFHPKEPLVTCSLQDGSIVILDIAEEPKVVSTLEGVTPSIPDQSDNRCSFAVFSPQGTSVAVPTKVFDVALYDSQAWVQDYRLTGAHTNFLTDVQWSPNGRYLATTARDGQVIIWDAVSREAVRKETVSEVIQIRWHPNENEISFTTESGRLYSCPAVPDGLPTPLGPPIHSAKKQRALEREMEDLQAEPQSDGLEEDDEENGDANGYDDLFVEQPRKRSKVAQTVQKFNPGTPWLNNKRYLCMNDTGYVWTVHQDSDHNTITISFHDESVQRDVHFSDPDRFDMASLTKTGCLFANSETGFVAMRFHAFSNDNWEFQIDEGDKIAAITLTDVVAVVATQRGIVTTFSVYGMVLDVTRQRNVFALAGHGRTVLVLRHFDQDRLVYSVEHFGDETHGPDYLISDAHLDVAPSELRTIFFGEFGDPCVYDHAGCLMTLTNWRSSQTQARWTPIFDGPSYSSKNGRQESYWPLGIVDSELLCIPLKGQQRFPPVPLPVTASLPLMIPGISEIESEYLCQRVMATQNTAQDEEELASVETALDKLLLRQFQLAASENRINKCLCIVRRLNQPRSGEAAVQIALHMDLTNLAEKIQGVLEQ
ncbi:Minichromosome loss protein 1 [Wickerhamiella sorbophila]|uniref:Minichromosome loss protein 1 n=1 Tax=Wickerhamiella sorbophila TaxID=45607 RepID=A0A2T0FND7_9ASCO|nr:Minichromosome loss protein 1 [Wickerhamiella sorbophila]PRT56479.1 Minichromosome loss protein 1 [Wickerhamiella sorbophila]